MKKVMPWVVAMVIVCLFGVVLSPVTEAAPPPDKGKPVPQAKAQFIESLTGGSCAIYCDGDDTPDHYTDADNAGDCACDCVDKCGGPCIGWDSEGRTATCEAN